eukprot:SM000057S18422  [mRNA]  locus=s57:509330:511661:+ [translate_table: standard]
MALDPEINEEERQLADRLPEPPGSAAMPPPLPPPYAAASAMQPACLTLLPQAAHQQAAAGEEEAFVLPRWLEVLSVLCHLAFFGIVGVLVRYGLERLFGPAIGNVTDDNTALPLDLPGNMVGCFFMGWVGVVFKPHIAAYSEPLAVGLSTGLMGSVTTYASWNQRMLALMAQGLWVRGFIGYLIGAELSIMSLIVGIYTASMARDALLRLPRWRCSSSKVARALKCDPSFPSFRGLQLLLFGVLAAVIWATAVSLTLAEHHTSKKRRVAIACSVGPPGVWLRWYLAQLNGHGIKLSKQPNAKVYLAWLPLGTLAANVLASIIEAALSTTQLAADNSLVTMLTASSQLGFCGCLSTVSTFVVELRALYQRERTQWRALAYITLSLGTTMALGILIYCVPVWIENYIAEYNHI